MTKPIFVEAAWIILIRLDLKVSLLLFDGFGHSHILSFNLLSVLLALQHKLEVLLLKIFSFLLDLLLNGRPFILCHDIRLQLFLIVLLERRLTEILFKLKIFGRLMWRFLFIY